MLLRDQDGVCAVDTVRTHSWCSVVTEGVRQLVEPLRLASRQTALKILASLENSIACWQRVDRCGAESVVVGNVEVKSRSTATIAALLCHRVIPV
jgi:hypothetical protein